MSSLRRNRIPLTLVLVAVLAATAVEARESDSDVGLTLDEALLLAAERSPELRTRGAEVEEARGRLLAARIFPYNPEVEVAAADRRGAGESSTDRGVALTQQLEIGGRRSKRVRVAELELASVEARYERARRLLAASVSMAFVEAVAAADLADLADTEAGLARELLGVTRRRFEAGAATQVDLNLALASAARSERRAELARAAAIEARSLLAEAVGLDPAAPPGPLGPLAFPVDELPPLTVLVAGALERRADLAAFRQAHEAARARWRLARAGRFPDLSVGVFYEEEEGTDRIHGGQIGFSLPFFHRNQGEIAEATAAIDRARAEANGQELAVRREVFTALARYRASRGAAEKLSQQVVGSLVENLELLERSYTAGKIGLTDLLVFRRELLDARQEQIEASAEAWIAHITLDLAAGRLPGPASRETDPEADR